MPRVIGIDPGTVTIDLCGLDEGRLFLGRALPTAEALSVAADDVEIVEAAAPDLVAARRATDFRSSRRAPHRTTTCGSRISCLTARGVASAGYGN